MTPLSRLRRLFRLRNLLLALVLLAVAGGLAAYFALRDLPSVEGLSDRRASLTILVRDWQGEEHPLVVGPANPDWTPLSAIPETLQWAVIVAEDANFYHHEGVDLAAVKEALKHDLQQKRLARGASTITQQLAKNLFLSREKTLIRKIREVVIARRMEEALTKGRILELYLNVVELGPLVHGVGEASRHYFDKAPADLNAAEAAFLVAMLPGPRVAYNPNKKLARVDRRAAHILGLLRGRGVIGEEEYRLALVHPAEIPGIDRLAGEREEIEALFAPPPAEPDESTTAVDPAPDAGESAPGELPSEEAPEASLPQAGPTVGEEPASQGAP